MRLRQSQVGDTGYSDEHSKGVEGLLQLSEALGKTLDQHVIHKTATKHLQLLIGQCEVLMITRANGWQLVSGGLRSHQPSALGTFPIFAGGKFVGLIGIEQIVDGRKKELSISQRQLLKIAISLVGLSIKNAQLFKELHELSTVDTLTGCLTRSHGINLMTTELQRAQRSEQPVSLIFIDLDHFKLLNDRYGHLFGDKVLSTVGEVIKASLRGSDLRCRYGGEEFVVLLPDTPLEGAKRVAESLRCQLARQAIKHVKKSIFVTASLGVSVSTSGELDAKKFLSQADTAMYRAKKDGRNCVRVWKDYPEWHRSQFRDGSTTVESKIQV